MKNLFRLSLVALVIIAVSSCTKSELTNSTVNPPPDTSPALQAKIYHFVNEPAEMELGTPNAILHEGEQMTFYVPYALSNDQLTDASVSLIETGTETELANFTLISYTDPSAATLNLPADLRYVPFMFVRFTPDNTFTGKTITIRTVFNSNQLTSVDELNAAFSVNP